MKIARREFITLLGGVVAVWPLAVRAQQAKLPTIRVLGVNTPLNPGDERDRTRDAPHFAPEHR
jgi:hypothetical protein